MNHGRHGFPLATSSEVPALNLNQSNYFANGAAAADTDDNMCSAVGARAELHAVTLAFTDTY